MPLGLRIRQLRKLRGLTQSQLGGHELSKGFISLLETNRARPSVESLALLARRLGTSLDALLGQEEHRPQVVADGLLALSSTAVRNQQFVDALKLLETVTFLATTHGLDDASREAQMQTAQVALEQRNFAEALAKLEAVRAASERAKDFWRVGRAMLLMGTVKLRQLEFPQAIAFLEEALRMFKHARVGRDRVRAEALIFLGTALVRTGNYTAAMRRYEQALRSGVARRDLIIRSRSLWGLGWTSRRMGDLDRAGYYLLEAKDTLEKAEELPDLVRVLHNLGQLLFEQGQARKALRYLHQALRVMDRLQMQLERPCTLTEIGRVHLSLGDPEETKHFAGQALEEAKKIGDPVEAAEAQLVLARAHHLLKDPGTAVKLLKEAVATFKERMMQPKLVEAATQLGLLLRERGAHAEAAEYLALVVEQATPKPDAQRVKSPPSRVPPERTR